MSSDVFDSIASRRAELIPRLAELRDVLAAQIVGVPIRLGRVADLLDIDRDEAQTLLELLVPAVLEVSNLYVCPHCEDLAQDKDELGRPLCDLCGNVIETEDSDPERCYCLKEPVYAPGAGALPASARLHMKNSLADPDAQALANIEPWTRPRELDYFLEIPSLGDEEQQRILDALQRWGVCQVRWSGMSPDHPRLRSLAQGIGPVCTRQNDFKGDIKAIQPRPDVAANTGDSAQELGFHVDGTQHDCTPAVLVFQYEVRPQHGGYSTFLDMSQVFSEFDEDRLANILTKLARRDCARFEKKGMKFEGPIIAAVHGGRALACRLRFDEEGNRVCTLNPECEGAFEAVQNAVLSRSDVLEIKPREGDIIIFDNWRVLHGRRQVGGRYQRLHDRMWISDLHARLRPKYSLGVRPVGAALMAAIQRANEM